MPAAGGTAPPPVSRLSGGRIIRDVASFSHRLTCLAFAFALVGSPALQAICNALCLSGPSAATTMDAAHTHHMSHGAAPGPISVSPHAHHASTASAQPAAAATTSPLGGDARVVGNCVTPCLPGAMAFGTGPGVDRTDGKALGVALGVEVVPFHLSLTAQPAATSSPIPPQSPIRAPLPLRI